MKNQFHLFLFLFFVQCFFCNTVTFAQVATKKTSQKYSLYYCNNRVEPDTFVTEYINYDEKGRKKEESSWRKCHALNFDSIYIEYQYGENDLLETKYQITQNYFGADSLFSIEEDTMYYKNKILYYMDGRYKTNNYTVRCFTNFNYKFDAQNRIIQTYNISNFLDGILPPYQETNYEYNEKGLVTTETMAKHFNGKSDTLSIKTYTYNAKNQCIEESYRNNLKEVEPNVVAKDRILYTYNTENQQTSKTNYKNDVLENTIKYSYNKHNDLVQQEEINKDGIQISILFWKHEYWK